MEDLGRILADLADAQGGHVARWQLEQRGVDGRSARRRLLRTGWRTVRRSVYRAPGTPDDPRAAAWVALLACADRRVDDDGVPMDLTASAIPTGMTAAALRGIVPNAPTTPQILIHHDARRPGGDPHVLRTRWWPDGADRVDGLPVTDPLRMLVDLGWILRGGDVAVQTIRRVASRADGLRLIDASALHLAVADPVAAGLARRLPRSFVRAATLLAEGHSHSALEARGRAIVREVAADLGLLAEPRPLDVEHDGRVVAQADVAIRQLRFDAEIDGPHHEELDQQASDRRRDDAMLGIRWVTRRYPTHLVEADEGRFRRRVQADLVERAAALGVRLAA